jgi:RNA polymerase sigma-70 factor (ECF subfamily)
MIEKMQRNVGEFDAWLAHAHHASIEATRSALDVEAMLTDVMRQNVVNLPTAEPAPREADEELAHASIAAVAGALALSGSPRTPPPRNAQVLQFPGGKSAESTGSDEPDASDQQPWANVQELVDDAVTFVDAEAYEDLLRAVRPIVVRYCRARIGMQERSFASADDVAQETCLAVLTALPGYRNQGRPFLAFVYGIAAHKVADAHRAAAGNRSEPVAEVPDQPDPRPTPEQAALQGELSGELTALLNALPPKQREIIVLRVVVGLSLEETADAVGSTPGVVRVAQHRAIVQLRRSLSAQ